MVDTTLSQPAEIKPPFADPVPDRTTPDVHSQPWNDFFTKQADRIADLWSRMAAAEYAIAHIKDGVTDGSDAAAGIIGEYLTASGGPVALANGVAHDVATVTLPAGDWDVTGSALLQPSGANLTVVQAWVSSAPNALITPGATVIQATTTVGVLGNAELFAGPVRYSSSAATTVHLGCQANFPSGTTVQASAWIRARRVR